MSFHEQAVIEEIKELMKEIAELNALDLDFKKEELDVLMSAAKLLHERCAVINYLRNKENLREENKLAEEQKRESQLTEIEEKQEEIIAEKEEEISIEEEIAVNLSSALDKEESVQKKNLTALSLHEKLSQATANKSISSKMQLGKILNLRTAIGLNDKFAYVNELFGGNVDTFNRAIDELNHLESFESALKLIEFQYEKNYKWDFENPTVKQFIALIERRYLHHS